LIAMTHRALITGLTGQDGSFLAELLLEKGYEVTGVLRREPGRTLGSSEHLRDRVSLVHGDLLDPGSLRAAVQEVAPSEIYHLAAPSFVPASWQRPRETVEAIAGSCAAILEAARELDRGTRVFISSSGAMFGRAPESPQNEETWCRPATPYAVAKLAAHQLAGVLRGDGELHVSSGILFNHESERRPEQFVTRRVSRGVAAIALGLQDQLSLGSLDAVRDWSFAGDIVRGAWMMLQQDEPADYVLASGTGHTVAELAAVAFACVDLDPELYVRVDPTLVRAPEPTLSVGDPTRARERLGWFPEVSFEQVVERMVSADLRSLQAMGATP
jgi:GDPmannose 4,6-dehydratase